MTAHCRVNQQKAGTGNPSKSQKDTKLQTETDTIRSEIVSLTWYLYIHTEKVLALFRKKQNKTETEKNPLSASLKMHGN